MPRTTRPRRRRLIVSLALCALAVLSWCASRVLIWQWLNSGGEPVRYADTPLQPSDWMMLMNVVGAVTLVLTVAALASLAVLVVTWIRGRRAV